MEALEVVALIGLSLLARLPAGSDDPGGRAGASPGDRLARIRAAQAEASRIYHLNYDRANDDAGRGRAIGVFLEAVATNTDRALELADESPRDRAALEALTFVLRTAKAGPGKQSERAIALLRRDHVRDEAMGEVCQGLFIFFHLRAAEDLLRAVASESPNERTRGVALDALANFLIYKAARVRELRLDPARVGVLEETRGKGAVARAIRDSSPEALEAEARTLLKRVVADHGKIRRGQRTLEEIAAGKLRDLEGLQVGDVAPDIEGEDADGKRFRLADHRGKVVLLTFSGEWCGPCRALYPHERELVDRLKDKPFVALSVNTDATRETLRAAIASGTITWRCWWDGGTDGPITAAWGVRSFPAIYLIDQGGVIRYKDINRKDMDAAIDGLLSTARAGLPGGTGRRADPGP